LSAQNPIPSYDVLIVTIPATFEEFAPSSGVHFNYFDLSFTEMRTMEEKKLNVLATDYNPTTKASAIIEVYSLDGSITYGPYTVIESDIFTMILPSSILWGVRIIDSDKGSEVDVWFE
jgi:hypothetical protein